MRKLAEQSSEQTVEITGSVEEIQRVTQTVLDAMQAAGTHVSATGTAMSSARGGLDSVGVHGQAVASISGQIADSTRAQALSGNKIAAHLEGIVNGTDQMTGAITLVSERTELLKDNSTRLQKMIAFFRFIR